eukprot:symbB.v1.2.027196.t1/scaffold2716.1/size72468/3
MRSYKAVLDAVATENSATSEVPRLLNALRYCKSSPLQVGQRNPEAAHALLLVEVFESEGLLDEELQATFVRRYLRPAEGILIKLQDSREPSRTEGHWNLQEPILERQTSLGQRFRLFSAGSTWQVQAKCAARCASNVFGAKNVDPTSMELVAWISAVLDREALTVPGRVVYYGDEKTRGTRGIDRCHLAPIFVGHDRAAHAERVALVRLLLKVEALSRGQSELALQSQPGNKKDGWLHGLEL